MIIKVKKSKLNLSIDIVMFIVMTIIAGIGFMIKYVLVPGFKRNEIYGKDVDLYFWGLDRHQWGTIHLIFGFVLLFLLFLHIVFHWKVIKVIYKRMVQRKQWRSVFVLIFLFAGMLFAIGPLLVKPEIKESAARHSNYQNQHDDGYDYNKTDSNESNRQNISDSDDYSGIEVYGFMTLKEVADEYKIDITELCEYLGIPASYEREKLGWLRKMYGLHMSDIRKYIYSQQKIRNYDK
jgi:hypothetical protein